jgi:hypothetical protein
MWDDDPHSRSETCDSMQPMLEIQQQQQQRRRNVSESDFFHQQSHPPILRGTRRSSTMAGAHPSYPIQQYSSQVTDPRYSEDMGVNNDMPQRINEDPEHGMVSGPADSYLSASQLRKRQV